MEKFISGWNLLNRMALGCEYICKKENREDRLEGNTLAHCHNAERGRKPNGMIVTIASM
jgi:hypothetical protein